MEDPIGLRQKIFAVVYAILLLGQEAHKTGPRGSEVGIRLQEVRNQLAAQVPLNQLAALDNPGPDYCGTVGCTPHPDSREVCFDLDGCNDAIIHLNNVCNDASFADECRDGSDAYEPHCDWLDAYEPRCDFDDTDEAWCPRGIAELCGTYDSTDAGEPNSTDAGEPNTCDHNWGNEDHHLIDYVYEKYKPLDEGDQVIIKDGATYHDGPSELVSTRSYEEGLPGTIVRTEERNNKCGVVIRFHGYENRQDNTMYPHSTMYGKGYSGVCKPKNGVRECWIPDGVRAAVDNGSQLDLSTRAVIRQHGDALYDGEHMAREDFQASGHRIIDEEVWIPRDQHHDHLWRIYTHPKNLMPSGGRLLDLNVMLRRWL